MTLLGGTAVPELRLVEIADDAGPLLVMAGELVLGGGVAAEANFS